MAESSTALEVETSSLSARTQAASHTVYAAWAVQGFFVASVSTNLIFAGSHVAALIASALLALAWPFLARMRIQLSEDTLRVRFGTFGPTVPIRAIHHLRVTPYRARDFGGWWVRRMGKVELFALPGDGGQAVEIKWADRGVERTTWIGTPKAMELAETLLALRSRIGQDG